MKKLCLILFVFGVSCVWVDEVIVIDWLDFVELSDVVGKGCFQIEISVVGECDKVDGVCVCGLMMLMLLCLGVSDMLELWLEIDG